MLPDVSLILLMYPFPETLISTHTLVTSNLMELGLPQYGFLLSYKVICTSFLENETPVSVQQISGDHTLPLGKWVQH